MKIHKIGEMITLPGAEDKAGLIVTGYEKDERGNIIGYTVKLASVSFNSKKPIIKTSIEQ